MYLKRDILDKILRIIIACILFTGATMCLVYALTTLDTTQWYWLSLCISGGLFGLVFAIVIVVSVFLY